MDPNRPDPEHLTVRPTHEEWRGIAARHGQQIVKVLQPMIDGDGLIRLTVAELASRASVNGDQAAHALTDLADRRVFIREMVQSCGCCTAVLTVEQTQDELCPHCEDAIRDCGVVEKPHYVRPAVRARDIAWVLVLHGMNTRGPWQEELSWLIANSYRRMVPIFIYKYGRIRHGAFVRWRQRQLARDLSLKISKLRETYGAEVATRPDVVAHSFGSWLIGHVLLENPDLAMGRIILAGSILRPDFDWGVLIDRGQVEMVLNHVAAKDRWVPFAHLVIPDAGPSGIRGFEEPRVIHRIESSFGHSSFFDEERVRSNYEDVWSIFLRRPTPRLIELGVGKRSNWRPTPHIVREFLRFALLFLATGLMLFIVICLGVGVVTLLGG